MFIPTQVASLFVAIINVLTIHASLLTDMPKAFYMILFLFIADLVAICYTYFKINSSED